MTIIMSFRQWRHYLEDVFEIEVWSDHANLRWFMSQMMLNSHQAHWLIQLMSYNFIIQYHQDSLNLTDESLWRLNYIMKQNERCHESSSILICSEKSQQSKKHHENDLISACSKEFWLILTLTSSSSSTLIKSSSIFWQMSNLIFMLVNKLVTVTLETGRQYSYYIRDADLKAECLIQVLSLQAITQSKIRLTADNLVSFRKTTSFDSLIRKSTSFNSLNVRKKKLSILNLIKDIQEFNSQCR